MTFGKRKPIVKPKSYRGVKFPKTNAEDEMKKMFSEIQERRNEFKEQFIKAWLSTLPANHLQIDWIIKHVELVEQWSMDRLTVKWYLQAKKKKRVHK
jgi:hypothetical protein